jgi:hypothetical protein
MRISLFFHRAMAAGITMLAMGAVMPARAGAIEYITPSGSTTGGGAVNAQADFVIGTDSITVTLTNLLPSGTKTGRGQAGALSDAQLLSGISFQIAGATGAAALTSSGGGEFLILGSSINAYYTSPFSLGTVLHWGVDGNGSSSQPIVLSTLLGHGKPYNLIIGPDNAGGFDGDGTYFVNPSVIQHEPLIAGSATFTLHLAGLTPESQLSNVVFQFGTSSGSNTVQGSRVGPQPSAVPEPGSLALAGIASCFLALVPLRKRFRKS